MRSLLSNVFLARAPLITLTLQSAQSLGFGSTSDELKQIATLAANCECFDAASGDLMTFDGFKKFFTTNLLELSKKNEIKAVKTTMKATNTAQMTTAQAKQYEKGAYDVADLGIDAEEEVAMAHHLATLFRMLEPSDHPRPGYLPHTEVRRWLAPPCPPRHLAPVLPPPCVVLSVWCVVRRLPRSPPLWMV